MTHPSARYPSLEQRVVFITGGGSGIGAALTRAFHRQGARVVFVDIAREASEALVEELAKPQNPSGLSALKRTSASRRLRKPGVMGPRKR